MVCSIGALVASKKLMTDVEQNEILRQYGSVYDMNGTGAAVRPLANTVGRKDPGSLQIFLIRVT